MSIRDTEALGDQGVIVFLSAVRKPLGSFSSPTQRQGRSPLTC